MLMKITNPGRPWLVLALLASSFVAGNASSQTQAQERPAEAEKTIDMDIEVWELGDSVIDEIDECEQLGGHWMSRLSLLGNLQEPKDKLKQTPPTRFRMKTKDGQATHLNMNKMTMGEDASLLIDLKPTLVGHDEVALDYEMVRRTKPGEVKVSAKQRVTFGNLMTQWIKPKPSDDAESQEKSWLVLMSPRHRTADGSDVVIAVDSRKETNAAGVVFVPRPGKFEMQVAEGWSGLLLVNLMDSPLIRLSGTTNVGASKDANASDHYVPLATFRAERPVLEVVHADDGFIQLVARRSGVASVRCLVPDLDGKSATCELQIVVSPDTTEIDRAIKEVLPQASIKVTIVKDAALLTGSVAEEDDFKLLLEIAEQFYPKIINRVKVPLVRYEVPEARGDSRPLAPPTGVVPATQTSATSLPAPDTVSPRIIPATAAEFQRNRPPRRGVAELKALHEDVRALREDVRRLSELLEKRLAVKNLLQEVPGNREAVPQTNAQGQAETKIQPNVLLSFTASWCGPCQKMQPIVKKLEREGCPIQTIDVDKSPDVAKRFHVQSIPCFIRLNEGKEIERITGLVAEQELRRLAQRTSHIPAGLEKRVSLSFEGAALKDVVKKLSELTDINVVLDKRGLEEEGLTPMASVSITLDDITARSALRLILEPINLDIVERNEVLLVTSRQRTKGEPTVAVYPVEDLFPLLDPAGKNTPERNDKCLKRIGEVIQSTISPDTWDAAGGPCSLRYYETTRSLVVRQTSDAHAEIARLLEQIRRLKRLPGRVSNAVGQPLIVMTYAVADLIAPIPGEPGDQAVPRTSDWLKLVDHITTTVEPENWTADGGPSSIETQEKTLSLVIRATPEMHAATADLLNAMRREQDVQIALETRVLQMTDDSALEQAGLKIEFDPRTRTARLDELDAKRLIEAVHSHHGETLSAPKITLFNGQFAYVQSEQRGQDGKLHGFKLYLRGTASTDRRGVRLNVALNPQSLVSELTRQSHKLNNGGYLLLDMTEQFHSSRRYPNPSGGEDLLLDKNGQLHPEQPEKPKGRVLVLVQPRILIQEEETLIGVPAKEDAVNFGGVRPRIIIQDEEEQLLGIPVNQKVGGVDASSPPAR